MKNNFMWKQASDLLVNEIKKNAGWTNTDTGVMLLGGPTTYLGKKSKEEGWSAPAALGAGVLGGAALAFLATKGGKKFIQSAIKNSAGRRKAKELKELDKVFKMLTPVATAGGAVSGGISTGIGRLFAEKNNK